MVNPARTFDWLNHLLACTFCNSHYKIDQYPVDAAGNCLSLGKYRGLTDKGVATIKVFKDS